MQNQKNDNFRTGSQTRAAWAKTRNPNRYTIWELEKAGIGENRVP